MGLQHDDATATVLVTGLALGCYNPSTQNWEIGLIRQPRHRLTIKVVKQTETGSSWMRFQLDDQHRIFVDSQKAIAPDSPFYTVGATLDRKDEDHDHEDFRWVIDFENELNNGEEVELQYPEDGHVTEMYVAKPLLYADTDTFALDPFFLVDTERTPPTRSEFGLFTEGAKADITCQDGGAVILRIEGPQGFEVYLPHSAGEPHFIHVDNTCPEHEDSEMGAGDPSDFALYYTMIQSTDGTRFDLKPRDGGLGEGAVCNKTFLGVRESLFPLS